MIDWNTEDSPETGKRVALKLPDGRICSGKVTETGGFELEPIDNMDLVACALSGQQAWTYL